MVSRGLNDILNDFLDDSLFLYVYERILNIFFQLAIKLRGN